MSRPTEAELDKAMRILGARILKARDCFCCTCRTNGANAALALKVMGWMTGRTVAPDLSHVPFAAQLASILDDEELCKLTHDPRMAEILPPRPEKG